MPRFIVDTQNSTVDVGSAGEPAPLAHLGARAERASSTASWTTEGRPRFDAPYSAELFLPVDAIKSGHGIQDREMRRRFDTGHYPTISARVTKGEALSERWALSRGGARSPCTDRRARSRGEIELQRERNDDDDRPASR